MNNQPFEPVRIGTVGLRNFGHYICRLLEKQSERPDPPVKLTAVCARAGSPPDALERLRAKGIRIVERFEDLLNEPIEALWLPLPIHLHRAFTEQAIAAGKAVMCEKPLASCVDDALAMLAAQKQSGQLVAIGYQDIYNPVTMTLKKRLQDGSLGRLQSIVTHVAGPRGDTYYQRSKWVGKFQYEGQWVMDSIANNAHAHEINLALYLAGAGLHQAAQPLSVEAELYRSNPIESFDTISMRLALDSGVNMLVLQTHACEFFVDSVLLLQCEKGRIIKTRNVAVIESERGTEVLKAPASLQESMVSRFAKAVRGIDDPDVELATIEMCLDQVSAVNGAAQAASIVDIPPSFTRSVKTLQGLCQAVVGMEAMITLCARLNVMMNESRLFDWTVPAVRMDLRNYTHFSGPRQNVPQVTRA